MGARHGLRAVIITATVTVAACGAPDSGVTSVRTSPIGPGTTTTAAPAPTTTSSEPPPTSATRATVTTPAPTTTTTLDPEALRAEWAPACAARTRSAPLVLDETRLATFGPLGLTPAFTLTLPTAAGDPASPQYGRQVPVSSAVRVPGGVVVVLTTNTVGTVTPVVAVNLDGSLRWIQCVDGGSASLWVAPVDTRPDRVLVAVSPTSGSLAREYVGLSLATGAVVTTHDDVARTIPMRSETLSEMWIAARGPDALVLADGPNVFNLTDVSALYRLDLRTLALTALPVPDQLRAPAPGQLVDVDLRFTERGDLTVTALGLAQPILTVLRNGRWDASPATLAAARPVLVTYASADQAAGLQGVDARGNELWSRPDLMSPSLQMFAGGGTDPVTVVNACTDREADGSCRAYATVAVEAATGRDLWRVDDFRQVAIVGDGYALMTDGPVLVPGVNDTPAPGWMMVDLATGQPVAGQAWSEPEAFRQECCGGSDSVWVRPAGGVVIATYGTRLRVWLPSSLGGAGVAVALG